MDQWNERTLIKANKGTMGGLKGAKDNRSKDNGSRE